jgi:chemotaxis signal transduction protein
MDLDVIFFEIHRRRCVMPVNMVQEVITLPALTPVPSAPPSVCGLATLRGAVIPVLDLGAWLGPGAEPGPEAPVARAGADKALLVEALLESGTPVRVALVVDRILRLGTVDDAHARPPPASPSFVTATMLDADGPAFLIDAAAAVECVTETVYAMVQA